MQFLLPVILYGPYTRECPPGRFEHNDYLPICSSSLEECQEIANFALLVNFAIHRSVLQYVMFADN